MKKFIVVLNILLLIGITNVFAEGDLIDGLEENMETLWLKNYFTQEQMDDMVEQYKQGFTEEFYKLTWPQAQTVWKKPQGLTQEEMLAYQLSIQSPQPEKGLKVYMLNTKFKYAKQYFQNGQIDYLISDNYYWIAPQVGDERGYVVFMKNGEYKNGSPGEKKMPITYIPVKSIEFIKDYSNLNDLLKNRDISTVFSIKVISLQNGLVFLYINTDKEAFFVEICGNDSYGSILPAIELYKVYTVSEIIEFIETVEGYDRIPVQGLQKDVLAEKDIYQLEAESLQSEGLLKGTDKGLDLLKPLTRAEAATMLIRAMGHPEVTENTVMTFSDVSSEYWGFGAIENAYSLGLVNGVGDGKFAPEQNVTAPQFATMILRAANAGEFDWEKAVEIMVEQGILTKEETETMDFFTRGDMAKMIYEARENNLF